MKKLTYLPYILIIATVLIFSSQFLLKGKLPVPADTIVGLYYPFRDLYSATNPNGIPFKNFLITDPIRQQYPWRLLSISLEKQGLLPLWNPYNFAGTPLLANMQSATLYPLNILLFVLPFQFGWSILILLQPLLSGLFLYLYLQKMKLNKPASILGSISFAFCGFNTAWLEWNSIGQVILWLPLILLAKEHLLQKIKSWQWILILIFAECSAIFAGHLQTLFYSMIISNLYLLARIIQISIKQHTRQTYIIPAMKKYLPFLIIGIIIFLVTAIQWLPTFQFINQSARNIDQEDWHKAGWFIPQQQLVQFIAPDFFGNPATLNYWGVWNYGEFIGYIGIIPLIFALFALGYRHDKKTTFFGTLFFFSLIFGLNDWLGQLPFILKIPFLSTAQPSRLLSITDFSLAILAALGLDLYLKSEKKRQIIYPLFFIGILETALWFYALIGYKFFGTITSENLNTIKHNLYFPSFLYASATILILLKNFISQKQKNLKYVLVLFLLIITITDILRFSLKFNPFTDQKYLFPQTQTLTFLQNQSGKFRTMAQDNRILPPNFSIMYHLESLDGYDPLYLQRYGEMIAAMERNKPDIHSPLGFNRIIAPTNYKSKLIDLLGVKYVLSLSDIHEPKLQKVFQNGQTQIYQNNNAYPRAFFVKNSQITHSKQESINALFDPKINLKQTAIIENPQDQIKQQFQEGKVLAINYTPNQIEIKTQTSGESFLILMDNYYPTWHAKICEINAQNCQNTKIYLTNYNFRGIVVPRGEYQIIFYTTLL